jgi:UDPglucose 6-dehydrogenase
MTPAAPTSAPSRNVAVIGAGYVGLTSAVCFAHLGHTVVCADNNPDKVASLAAGHVTHHEPGLADLLAQSLASGRLKFVLGAATAVTDAEFIYLCLPTPMLVDGRPDLGYLTGVADEIGPHLLADAVVVNKSTVPVGATRLVAQHLGRSDVAVVSNPEFLREGQAINDFLHPDRVVIGSEDSSAAIRVGELFASVGAPVVVTDPVSAETIKYAANAFLATKLSFVNAVAAVCEAVGADADDVLLGVGYDHRVGHDFLRPGPGWGGSCFPKDTRALLHMARDAGYEFDLLQAVLDANDDQFTRVANKVTAIAGRPAGGDATGLVVAAWGLAFKANTDDLRESPALAVLQRLADAGAVVRAYDPVITAAHLNTQTPGLDIAVVDDPYAVCEGADVLVVLTEWDEFRYLDMAKVADMLAAPRVVDTRNVLDRNALQRLGFTADLLGR